MTKESQVVFACSGQGTQHVGMGKDLYENSRSAKAVYEEASEAVGINIMTLSFEDPDNQLGSSEYSQTAIVVNSVAIQKHLEEERGVHPDVITGHSTGQIAATIGSGAIPLKEGALLARARGKAIDENSPPGLMTAVFQLYRDKLQEISERVASMGFFVAIANENSPEQTVLSGDVQGVELAEIEVKNEGGRAKRIKGVKVPGHTERMEPARRNFEEYLQSVKFEIPKIRLVSDITAQYLTSANQIKETLGLQIVSSVEWLKTVKFIIKNGGLRFYITGPGNSLANLIKRIDPTVEIVPLDF